MSKSNSQKSKSKSKGKNSISKKSQKKRPSKSNSSLTCPPGMEQVKTNEGVLCVGRCPHSGGPIYYNPKLDKLVCKWHGAQFSKSGKVLAPPAQSNLKVKKLKKLK
jgi:Rieske Fe-S protein